MDKSTIGTTAMSYLRFYRKLLLFRPLKHLQILCGSFDRSPLRLLYTLESLHGSINSSYFSASSRAPSNLLWYFQVMSYFKSAVVSQSLDVSTDRNYFNASSQVLSNAAVLSVSPPQNLLGNTCAYINSSYFSSPLKLLQILCGKSITGLGYRLELLQCLISGCIKSSYFSASSGALSYSLW
ncbi:unnamed protein product [Haemonchus placei]|uniref:Ovule protein n=1 Tax=Haemonchus placei TaxID=6290 RepID=A0A0N4XBI4_HAEPC|nr:unnamed protein product [Haemonchus placei]